MDKKRVVAIAILITFVMQVTNLGELSVTSVEMLSSQDNPIIPDCDQIRTNIVQNPSFEEVDTEGGPSDWDYHGSSWQDGNLAYTDRWANGSQSGIAMTHGNAYDDGYTSLYYQGNPGPYAYLEDNVSLSTYFQVSDLGISENGRARIRVGILGTSYPSYYLNYYVSYGSYTSYYNGTRNNYYLMNGTIGNWRHLSRNITSDFENALYFPALDSTFRVVSIYFSIVTKIGAGYSEILADTVILRNSTYSNFVVNGDFENPSCSYWDYYENEEYRISQSNLSTDGSYSANMSAGGETSSTGSGWLYNELDYPSSSAVLFNPGDLVLSFDWRYSDTGWEWDTAAYIRLTARNTTGTWYFNYHLGSGTDNPNAYNGSTSYHFVKDWNSRCLDYL